uniref:E3 ubiquitin-protein ligase RMA n=1 Tax=Rhizophora mucronata TaxID=61149 RepID=A0A2P2LRN4_RHIMU
MALEQYLEAVSHNDINGEDKSSLEKLKTISETLEHSDESAPHGFDCNICLDSVQDPVVTFCGHLYCWPCIYKWLHVQSISSQDQNEMLQQQCPVCKAEVSESTLVPLFGRGQTTRPSKGKVPSQGITIPQRPFSCGVDLASSPHATSIPRATHQFHHHNYTFRPHLYHPQPENYPTSVVLRPDGTRTSMNNPVIGMLGEMIYERVFDNSINNAHAYSNSYHLAGTASPRVRRQVRMADKSLSRITFFLFCCAFLCLLLF